MNSKPLSLVTTSILGQPPGNQQLIVNTKSIIRDPSFQTNDYVRSITLIILTMIVTQLSACNSTISMTAMQLADQIANNKAPIILDTRSRFEYDNEHVPNALFFPFWKAFFADNTLLERCKSEPVIVYCQHGPRASFAGFALRQSGCSKVIELEGHMVGWQEQGLPVIAATDKNKKTDKQQTSRVTDDD